jgi:malonyl CoA-acyl carrier protein transacylase/methionyl-tRNA formyltransferase/acyl carrier protein
MENSFINKKIAGVFAGNDYIMPACVDIFRKKGGEVTAVFTGNDKIKQWAYSENLKCLDENDNPDCLLNGLKYDYLFGITESSCISHENCTMAGKAAIKLSIGKLPEYAGANTPFWALHNREIKHGVTWHIIDGNLENEDIVKLGIIEVNAGETAGTLIEKCYIEAAESFRSLVDDIFDGGLRRTKQDLGRRVYKSKFQKPILAGIINWDQPGENIFRLVNILKHGNYDNYITLPKIRIEDDLYIIESLGLTGKQSEYNSGTVVNVSEDGIVINTKSNNVILHQISDLYGRPIDIKEVINKYSIEHGFIFQYISNACAANLHEYDFEINKNEDYWVKELSNINPDSYSGRNQKNGLYDTISIHPEAVIPKEYIEKSNLTENGLVRAFFILYILQRINKKKFTFAFYNEILSKKINSYFNLFSRLVPVNINVAFEDGLLPVLQTIDTEIIKANSKKTFYNDVFARYPKLKSISPNKIYDVAIAQIDKIDNYKDIEEVLLTFVSTGDNKYYLNFNTAGLTEKEIELRIKDFYCFIQKAVAADEGSDIVSNKEASLQKTFSPAEVADVEIPENPAAESVNIYEENKKIVFMFPWEGAVFQNMAGELYKNESVFRKEVDNCFNILESKFNINIRDSVFTGQKNSNWSNASEKTLIILISTFIIEYSLAKFWIALGVKPTAMIGHSAGEYVAACLSGVISLEDILKLLIAQSRMLAGLPPGGMLSIAKSHNEITDYLFNDISLAAINSEKHCVVSGSKDGIDSLLDACMAKEIDSFRLDLELPEHSGLLIPLLYDYKFEIKDIDFNKPAIPFISSITGDWITAEQALSLNYWAEQPAKTVRFESGIKKLLEDKENIFLEIGPGRSLVYLLSLQSSYDIKSCPALKCTGEKISEIDSINRAVYFLEKSNIKINFFNYDSRQSYFIFREKKYNRTTPAPYNESRYAVLNETQLFMADLWMEMLDVENISIDDNFINLGGNSLLLIRCINTINHYFKISLPLKKVFREPTITNIENLIYKAENINLPGQVFIKPVIRDLYKSKAYAAN